MSTNIALKKCLNKKPLLFLITLVILFLFSFSEFFAEFESPENNIKQGNKSLNEMLGSSFVVGFDGYELDEETIEAIKHIKPSGIVLYARNCKDEEQLKSLTSELQDIAKEIGDYEFFIMIDEEPGGASRLRAFDYIFISGEPDWEEVDKITKLIRSTGVNVNLAPVADYPFNENTFIKRRIPAKSPEDLMYFNRNFIEVSQKNNLSATLKHFPGLGVFTEDPHNEIPSSSIAQSDFEKSLSIFKDGIDAGADFVMTSHAIYENIDSNKPATVSPVIVKEILKTQLGFQGLIITDDLSDMPLARGTELHKVGKEAMEAGHHLIMFSHNIKRTEGVFNEMLEETETNPEFQTLIRENYEKISEFRSRP